MPVNNTSCLSSANKLCNSQNTLCSGILVNDASKETISVEYLRWSHSARAARLKNPIPLHRQHFAPHEQRGHGPILFICATIDIPNTIEKPSQQASENNYIMATGQPFASRSYAGSKLPERSVNTNAMPFSASSFSRHRGLGASAPGEFGAPDPAKPQQQQPQQQSIAQPGAAQSHGPPQDTNPLNRLTEEQREEINEAVSISLVPVWPFMESVCY